MSGAPVISGTSQLASTWPDSPFSPLPPVSYLPPIISDSGSRLPACPLTTCLSSLLSLFPRIATILLVHAPASVLDPPTTSPPVLLPPSHYDISSIPALETQKAPRCLKAEHGWFSQTGPPSGSHPPQKPFPYVLAKTEAHSKPAPVCAGLRGHGDK